MRASRVCPDLGAALPMAKIGHPSQALPPKEYRRSSDNFHYNKSYPKYRKMKFTKIDMNYKFTKRLRELIAAKSINAKIFTKLQHSEMIQKVKISESNPNKKHEDLQRLRRFNVISDGDREQLVAPSKRGKTPKIYVNLDEIFDILHENHLAIGHGMRNRMEKTLTSKYKNITKEMVAIYIHLCKKCEKKQANSRKYAAEKSILTSELNSKVEVDILSMVERPDGEYSFIMVYRDNITKFVQLRPLKTDRVKEVALIVLDLFTIFGAPNILHCERNRSFANGIVSEIKAVWPDLKMVHGPARYGYGANETIRAMVGTWMRQNNTRKWTEGIRLIQLMINRAHNPRINCSPYEAMFGTTMKLGIPSALAEELPDDLKTEEELRALLDD